MVEHKGTVKRGKCVHFFKWLHSQLSTYKNMKEKNYVARQISESKNELIYTAKNEICVRKIVGCKADSLFDYMYPVVTRKIYK